MASRQENVKWVDGLRGVASLLVVFTHIARAFDEDLFNPTSAEGLPPRIFQYPIIRLLFQGRIGVNIFSLVTGYVCALKPIRQIRAGNTDGLYQTITKSALRRIPRLLLPTSLTTTLIWLLCQFGAFEVGNHIDSWWVNFTSPDMTPYFGEAIKSLLYHLISTWSRSWNIYDNNQWTLMPLLKGAMLIYVMLAATAHCTDRYRMLTELGLFIYYYVSNDSAFGMQFFFGAFLSDLSLHPPHQAWLASRKWPSRIIAPVLILFGLFLASYPEDKAQWMTWSRIMGENSVYLFPEENDTPRYYTGLGLIFIALGIHFSPLTKNILSSKYLLWFGKNSFAVYLLHGALLRSVLVWMLFGFKIPDNIVNEEGEVETPPSLRVSRIGKGRWYFWLPIWFVMLYWIANLWTKYVDPFCARLTERLVKRIQHEDTQTQGHQEKPLLPH